MDKLIREITRSASPNTAQNHRYLHGADMEPEAFQRLLSNRRARVERNRQRQRVSVVSSYSLESKGHELEAVRKENSWVLRNWGRNLRETTQNDEQ